MYMINCLVKRLPAYGFERPENARFDIFPQRFSNEFQVFNVFHNRLSLLCSKAPCNKIVLHVYYNQKLHKILHSAGALRRRNREQNFQFCSAILATL